MSLLIRSRVCVRPGIQHVRIHHRISTLCPPHACCAPGDERITSSLIFYEFALSTTLTSEPFAQHALCTRTTDRAVMSQRIPLRICIERVFHCSISEHTSRPHYPARIHPAQTCDARLLALALQVVALRTNPRSHRSSNRFRPLLPLAPLVLPPKQCDTSIVIRSARFAVSTTHRAHPPRPWRTWSVPARCFRHMPAFSPRGCERRPVLPLMIPA